jgi:hypothetical protein
MVSKAFVLAGRASFVVENPQGESVTVKLNKAKPKTNPYTGQPYAETYFVSVRHNNHPWQFIGRLQGEQIVPTANVAPVWAQPGPWWRAIRVAQWGLNRIFTQTAVPQGYRLAHTGRCGKCGKLLRDAESIAIGLGPVCRG